MIGPRMPIYYVVQQRILFNIVHFFLNLDPTCESITGDISSYAFNTGLVLITCSHFQREYKHQTNFMVRNFKIKLIFSVVLFSCIIQCFGLTDLLTPETGRHGSDLSADSTKIKLLINSCHEKIFEDADFVKEQLPLLLELSVQSGNIKGQAIGYQFYGIIDFHEQDYESAIAYFEKALSLYRQENDENGIASVHSNLGSVYQLQGKYVKCIELYQDALTYYEQLGPTKKLVTCLNNLSSVYITLGLIDEGEVYCSRALGLAEELQLPKQIATCRVNLGVIASKNSDGPSALEYYGKSMEYFRSVNDTRGLANCLLNMAVIHQSQGDMVEAFDMNMEALQLYKKLSDREKVSKALNNIGVILEKVGSHRKAISLYKQALVEIEDGFVGKDIALIFKNLSKVYEKTDDYKLALLYHQKYKTVSDSILSLAKARQVTDLEMKYETAKQLQTIELQKTKLAHQHVISNTLVGIVALFLFLAVMIVYAYVNKRRDNEKITAQNVEIARQYELLDVQKQELEELNLTKDKLFSVIGHDLRGPIANIRSFFDLIMEDDLSDRMEMMEVFRMLRDKTIVAHNLLENLLYWSRSQQGKLKAHKEEVNLTELVEDNIDLIKADAIAKGIKLEFDLSQSVLAICDREMINLVLRNLLSNALKFTPSGGSVAVTTQIAQDYVQLSVSDTGIGIPPKDIIKIFDPAVYFTTHGTNREKGSGLGVNMCREFVETNGGHITVDSEVNHGSTFSFTVPAAKGVFQTIISH